MTEKEPTSIAVKTDYTPPSSMKVRDVALTELEGLAKLWTLGAISKWDFYPRVIYHHQKGRVTYSEVADVSGVDEAVIRIRVRNMREALR